MPDAMEIIFQMALTVGKNGAVCDYLLHFVVLSFDDELHSYLQQYCRLRVSHAPNI